MHCFYCVTIHISLFFRTQEPVNGSIIGPSVLTIGMTAIYHGQVLMSLRVQGVYYVNEGLGQVMAV